MLLIKPLEVKVMVKVPLLRIGRKKTGSVSIKDGEFKMVVKERARLIGVVTAFFAVIIVICVFLFPYVIVFLGFVWLITTALMSGLLDALVWGGGKITGGVKWVGKWCIKQPIRDYRYGRRKRKELEDTKTYGTG